MKNNTYMGCMLAIMGFLFLAAATAISKELSNAVTPITLLFFQFAVCAVLLSPMSLRDGLPALKTKRLPLHLGRSLGGLISYLIFLISLKSVPLVNANLLLNASPIWVPFIMFFWMRESIAKKLWLWLIVGFIGVLIILRPRADQFIHIGTLMAMGAGMLYAYTMVCMKRLSGTEPVRRTLFIYFWVCTLFSLPVVMMTWHPITLLQLSLLLMAGLCMFGCQFLVTLSFNYARPSAVAPMAYAGVIFAGIFDFIFWHHIPSSLSFVGILLVIIGGVAAVRIEARST